jgi:hypothetical protein
MQHTALVDKTKNMIMDIILRCPFCGTRFYNNAAKIFGTEAVLCRRFVNLVFMTAYKESGSS